MVKLEVNNKTPFTVDAEALKKEAEKLVKGKEDFSISVGVVSEDESREINKKWRNKDEIASVLSFVEKEVPKIFCDIGEGNFLGEIILCPSYIKKKAEKYGREFEAELKRHFRHGLMHLLGMSHKRMRESKRGKRLTT